MSVIKVSAPNPLDGTTTFDQIQHGEANDSAGSGASVINTASIDTTNRDTDNPGTTDYTYTSGSITKYYSSRYKNSTSAVTSDWGPWVKGGKDRWDTQFETEMTDTAEAVWSQDVKAQFKQRVLAKLNEVTGRNAIDTSLVIDNDSTPKNTYTVPFGFKELTEVGVGDVNNVDSTFKEVTHNNWRFEAGLLHILNLSGLTNALPIRLVGKRKFLEVGDVPEKYDFIVMYGMKHYAYLFLSEDFPRFNKWAQLQSGSRVSFENMRVQAITFNNLFKDELEALRVASQSVSLG